MQERETTFICDMCHQEHPVSQLHHFDECELCEDCYQNETTTCCCCGERIWNEDAESDGNTVLCLSCYERHYTHCCHCDRLICYDDAFYMPGDEDQDEPYCGHCIDSVPVSTRKIQMYGYKPTPIFYGQGKRFFGVELEIDDGGESDENAARLMKIANSDAEHIYCKHDGSIHEGFEIVSHPLTLAYHMNHMPWQEICENAIDMGYLSHTAGTCGLHIHVNRDSFGDSEERQEAAIARILFFVENHWQEMLRLSRRTQKQLNDWCSRYGRKDNPKEQMDHVKKQCADRYRAINLTNRTTIEFRLFRGTLRYTSLGATIQLVSLICDLADRLSDMEMEQLAWSDFVAMISPEESPELIRYLKERRLYVNDPVESAGEV